MNNCHSSLYVFGECENSHSPKVFVLMHFLMYLTVLLRYIRNCGLCACVEVICQYEFYIELKMRIVPLATLLQQDSKCVPFQLTGKGICIQKWPLLKTLLIYRTGSWCVRAVSVCVADWSQPLCVTHLRHVVFPGLCLQCSVSWRASFLGCLCWEHHSNKEEEEEEEELNDRDACITNSLSLVDKYLPNCSLGNCCPWRNDLSFIDWRSCLLELCACLLLAEPLVVSTAFDVHGVMCGCDLRPRCRVDAAGRDSRGPWIVGHPYLQ